MENDSVGQAPSPANWWVAEKKGAVGPFPLEELRRRITLESWVWRPGWEDWRKATTLCEADLAETDENRALFGGAPLFQPKPPPRGMFLNNLWLWGLLVLPLLGLFVFGIVLGVVFGEAALMELGEEEELTFGLFSLLYVGAVTIVCLIMDVAALKDAGYDDKRPFWIIGLFSAPLYVAVRAWRTMTGERLALTVLGAFVCLIVWVWLLFS